MSTILKKLRLKFMLMTTGIVAVLVVIIATVYCVSVYTSASTEVDIALDHAINSSSGQNPFPQGPQGQSKDQGFPGNGSPPNPEDLTSDQRIDLFHGQSALVYSVIIDSKGTVLQNNSPAIEIDPTVLKDAIDTILSSPGFSTEEGSETSGKINSANLFYRTKVENGTIYLGLTDSSLFDARVQDAIFGSLALAAVILLLTVAVSFFLARLFLRPVEEAWTKQRRFIADASHELKTPLTVIMANTEIVRSYPDDLVKNQMKWLDGTMDESERMNGLIADLLLLARIDDEQVSSQHASEEIVNFSEAVENTLMSFEAIAFERNLTIEESVESDLFIKGVKSRLVRLPDILLDNACKYASPKSLIKVSLKTKDDKVVLRVFNSGPEISEEDTKHLFDRFYRADESRSDDIPGYGLGLSIAQSIVEECGGTIEVENVVGTKETGSTEEDTSPAGVAFTVTLPQAS